MVQPTADVHCPCSQEEQADSGAKHVTYPGVKQGEHLVLKRLELTSGMTPPSTSVLKAYDEIFGGDPDNMQALRELFPPDSDVGPRKRRRCHSVA